MSRADRFLERASSVTPRAGPLREGTFASPLHTPRVASVLGLCLGIAFGVCFLTGLLSHLIQYPPGWFWWPASPSWLYRVTQGLHVITGIACIPLLLGKLWSVYPKLFSFPPLESVAHLVERISLVPLVGGSLFMLFSGVASITRWNPWPFSFPTAHWVVAWITIGALVVHIGAKATLVRTSLRRGAADPDPAASLDAPGGPGLSRRGFFAAIFGTAGVLTLVTAGQTIRPLEWLGLLAPRRPSVGPQGFPVNKTADSARVIEAAMDPAYELHVTGAVETPLILTLEDLRALPQHEATLPIACVDGWSANVHWSGVQVRALLEMAGATEGASGIVRSLQSQSRAYSSAEVSAEHAWAEDTLLALEANGEPLVLDHGYPVRLIGPNRPGVMQTKWVAELEVVA